MKPGDRVSTINQRGAAVRTGVVTFVGGLIGQCNIQWDHDGRHPATSWEIYAINAGVKPTVEVIDVVTQLGEIGRFLPTESDIGRGVVYTPPHGGQAEDGVLTSFNDEFAFVRYKSQHPGAPGQATPCRSLRWA